MAEKDRRIAEIEKQILNEIEDAKAAKRREQAENASPRYICFATHPIDCAVVSDSQVFLAHHTCTLALPIMLGHR